ncbi:MAG: hypothetical protein AB7G28_08035 [Pirellulales bacterium]
MIRLTPFLLILALAGCNSSAPNAPVAEAGHDHEHSHEHASGPHGGDILELGEYHGELIHDDAAGTVTVFILDGAAAENVPVDAKEAVINITREGLAKQFKLAASPVEGEPENFSSRFVSSEAELITELDNEGAAAVFAVDINGEPHRGMVEHHHDHDHDHAHEHGDHDEHEHAAGEAAHDHEGETAEEHAAHADETGAAAPAEEAK